jgi:hypothetical protein
MTLRSQSQPIFVYVVTRPDVVPTAQPSYPVSAVFPSPTLHSSEELSYQTTPSEDHRNFQSAQSLPAAAPMDMTPPSPPDSLAGNFHQQHLAYFNYNSLNENYYLSMQQGPLGVADMYVEEFEEGKEEGLVW